MPLKAWHAIALGTRQQESFGAGNGATQKVSKLRETPRARARKAIEVYAFSSHSQWVQGRREPTLSTVEWSLEVLSSGNSDHGPRLNSDIQQGGQPGVLGHYRVSCCTHSHFVQLHQQWDTAHNYFKKKTIFFKFKYPVISKGGVKTDLEKSIISHHKNIKQKSQTKSIKYMYD